MKLSHAFDGYWLDRELEFSPTTVKNYKGVFRRFLQFVGDKEVEQINAKDVRRFLDTLYKRNNLTKRSIHSYWVILSSFWTWAEQELDIEHAIRNKVPAPDYRKRVIMPLTQEEVKKLADAAAYTRVWQTRTGKKVCSKRDTGDRDKAIVLTLVDTGLRASELCALTVADYDEKRGRLHVQHGKGDKERFVVMGNRARKALWRYLTGRKGAKPTDPLFAARSERHLERNNLRHLVGRLGQQAGVENVYPHRFRHTFAVEFLRNGGNIMMLKELLGHEKLDMVMNYVRLAEQDLDGSAQHSPADSWRL